MLHYTKTEATLICKGWADLLEWASTYTSDLHRRLTGPYYKAELAQLHASSYSSSTRSLAARAKLIEWAEKAISNGNVSIQPSKLQVREPLALTYIAVSYYMLEGGLMTEAAARLVDPLRHAVIAHQAAWQRHMADVQRELEVYTAISTEQIVKVHPPTEHTQDQLGEIAAEQAEYYGKVTEG